MSLYGQMLLLTATSIPSTTMMYVYTPHLYTKSPTICCFIFVSNHLKGVCFILILQNLQLFLPYIQNGIQCCHLSLTCIQRTKNDTHLHTEK